jgi:hypothetical protein
MSIAAGDGMGCLWPERSFGVLSEKRTLTCVTNHSIRQKICLYFGENSVVKSIESEATICRFQVVAYYSFVRLRPSSLGDFGSPLAQPYGGDYCLQLV